MSGSTQERKAYWRRGSAAGLLVGALLGIATVAMPAPVKGQDSATAFVHVAVVPMDRERVLEDQTVVVDGGRIVALGSSATVKAPVGARRVDGRGKYLIPGLTDMHVHLRYSEGDDTVDIRNLLFVLLANGITTVRDMHSGGPGSWTLDIRRRVAAGELLGPRIYTAGDPWTGFPPGLATIVTDVEALKAAGHDFVKYYDWPPPIYDSVARAAAHAGLRMVGHVPHAVGVRRALQDHWASIEHLTEYLEPLLDPSGRWSAGQEGVILLVPGDPLVFVDTAGWIQSGYRLDPTQMRELAVATQRAGVWNCPTLAMGEMQQERIIGFTKDSIGPFAAEWRARLQIRRRWIELKRQIVRALQDAGAGLLVGSDFGAGQSVVPGFSIHQELAALTQPGGLTPYEALVAATRSAAQFLGALDSTGTVAVGKRADLVLLSGNPLADLRNVAGPAGVMLGGRWLPRREIEARLDAFPLRTDAMTSGAVATPGHADQFYAWIRESRLRLWQR